MAGFDPSVISQIPDGAPDFAAAKAKGIQLADMVDQNQMRKLALKEERQNFGDQQKAREILKDASYSTPEGVTQTAEKLTRAGLGNQAMDFMKLANTHLSGQVERETLQLQQQARQHDIVAGALDQVVAQLDDLRAKGATPAQLDAAALKFATPVMQQLVQQYPQLQEQIATFAKNPQNLTYQGIKSAEAQTNKGQELMKQRLAERKADLEEEGKKETERHNREMEATGRGRLDLANRKDLRDSQGNLNPEAVDLAAQRLINGEEAKSVLANFGRGKQGAADIAAVQNRFAAMAREQGLSADDIALRIQEMRGSARAELELGAREGKIAPRVQEAKKFAELALAASADVPRGDWKGKNNFLQWVQDQASGKELGRFQAANVSLINAYAAAIGGGTIHMHDQEVGAKLLSTANGPEAYKAKVEQLITETETALKAPEDVKQQWRETRARDAAQRRGPNVPPAAPGATPPAPGAAAAAPGAASATPVDPAANKKAWPNAPAIGTVEAGHRYKGG